MMTSVLFYFIVNTLDIVGCVRMLCGGDCMHTFDCAHRWLLDHDVACRARQLYKNISMLFLFPVTMALLFTNI